MTVVCQVNVPDGCILEASRSMPVSERYMRDQKRPKCKQVWVNLDEMSRLVLIHFCLW